MIRLNNKYQIINNKLQNGSAIILAVVLTSLLAIVAVIFLISSRVDNLSTSAISDNKNLNLAVDTVITQISEQLVLNSPRADANGVPIGGYYNYPDGNNPWLACLEPYGTETAPYWRQISDIYSKLYPASQNMPAGILPEYSLPKNVGDSTPVVQYYADADGDGVGDSMWVQVQGINSSKGKTIYAAIRIIDNSGMLNVNTGYKFDPNDARFIDGSSQLDINLVSLSWRPYDQTGPYSLAGDNALLLARSPVIPSNFSGYEQGVIWQYGNPDGNFTPFDISDELELRNRFVLYHQHFGTRIEDWSGQFRKWGNYTPFDSSNYNEWFHTSCIDANTLAPDYDYAYRHIATTYNFDQVINPAGQKMVNLNTAQPSAIRSAIKAGLVDANLVGDINGLSAQITANLIDYRDDDSNVTVVYDDANIPHFGFETPCIYISEIAESIIHYSAPPNDYNVSSFAIELYKPYWTDLFPSTDPCNGWQLVITDKLGSQSYIPIVWSGSSRFHVIEWIDSNYAPIPVEFNDVNGPNDVNEPNNPTTQHSYIAFGGGEFMELQRRIPDTNSYLTVDYVWVPEPNNNIGWLWPVDSNAITQKVFSYQRDIGQGVNPNKCIRGKPIAIGAGLWSGDFGTLPSPSLGAPNPWASPEPYIAPYVIQAHPKNGPLTNVGEIGMLFRKEAYRDINAADTEITTRLNLVDPAFQQVFKYLTVMDPNEPQYGGHPFDETRIKGRININTAPWFVLAQLPWASYQSYDLARSIAYNRDIRGGYKSIGELMTDANNTINSIGYYEDKAAALPSGLLIPPDGIGDAYEQRDAIFARISNLVTVRSDIFTAYILVRIGVDGPQKRVVAILDRSESPNKPVKIIAIQSVPDPR